MREVKAQPVRLYQRAGLMDMVAEHLLQRRLKQMGGGVGARDSVAPLQVQLGGHLVIQGEAAGAHLAVMKVFAALGLLGVGDLKDRLAARDAPVVAHLAAHLGVERGLVQDEDAALAGVDGAGELAVLQNRLNLARRAGLVVAEEAGGRPVDVAQVNVLPAEVAQGLARLSGALLLRLHLGGEGVFVHRHPLVGAHLHRQVNREAVGVIEAEGIRT